MAELTPRDLSEAIAQAVSKHLSGPRPLPFVERYGLTARQVEPDTSFMRVNRAPIEAGPNA